MRALRPVARAYLISIGIWCGLSLLTAWQYRIFDRQFHIHSSLMDTVLLAESRGFAYALLTPPIFYFVWRYAASIRHPLRYVCAYALALPPFMAVYASIRWAVLPLWDANLQHYVPRSARGPLELIREGFADQITMYIAITLAAHAYQYYERVRKQEVQRYEFRQALVASELHSLKAQLHPHFLFNTLHGIATLIDSDQRNAKAMVLKLSSLLRTSLTHSSSDLISLGDELKFIGEYVELEKMRLGPRLSVRWKIEPDTRQVLVPQLILQPLVENAIRHGIACAREGGWLELTSERRNGICELRVRNSVGEGRSTGTGLGLRNTEARLRHLYGDEARFSFAVSGNLIATATVILPALGGQQQTVQAA